MGLLKAATDAHSRAKASGDATREREGRSKEAQAERDAHPKTRWEYRTIRVGADKQKGIYGSGRMNTLFNQLGARGWELVAVNMERATFKREVPHMSAAEIEEFAEMPAVPDLDEPS